MIRWGSVPPTSIFTGMFITTPSMESIRWVRVTVCFTGSTVFFDAIAGGIAGAGKIFPTGYAVKKEREAYDEYAECSANPPADDPNCYKAYDKVEKRKKMCEHVSQAGERH